MRGKMTKRIIYVEQNGDHGVFRNHSSATSLTELSDLQQFMLRNPNLAASNSYGRDPSQLILVGQGFTLNIGPDQVYIDNLFVSSSGQVTISINELFADPISLRSPLEQFLALIKYLQIGGSKLLDHISESYYYNTEKQAFRMIDVMARDGLINFSDSPLLAQRVSSALSDISILALFLGNETHEQMKNIQYCLPKLPSHNLTLAFLH